MTAQAPHRALAQALARLSPAPRHPALRYLVEALEARHQGCASAFLYYGSCLRSGDPYDGLVDLYMIVDEYRCANSSRARAVWNRLLPPNVFYAEFPHQGKTLRCKYAVLSLADLRRGTSRRWFHSYLWGRFSQPTAIAWCRDTDTQRHIEDCLAQAVVTFLERILPAAAPQGTIDSLWEEGLKLSYRAELRVESGDRARELVQCNHDYYETVTRLAQPLLKGPLELAEAPDTGYRYAARSPARLAARLGWRLRIAQGKLLSVARLVKALFTFDGGLDYLAWKLERHSGVPIDIPDRVRRHPLIFIWGMFWDLYRRGVFR